MFIRGPRLYRTRPRIQAGRETALSSTSFRSVVDTRTQFMYGNGAAKEALEAGADRAATKPVQFSALAVEIRELLFRSQLQGRPEPQAPAE